VMLVKYLGMNRLLLVVCALVGAMFCQEPPKVTASTPLKEYSYPSDGFAIKFPYAPEPHTDSIHSDFKVWTIHLSQRAAISIRLKVDSQPCDVALEKLKSMAKAQNVPIKEFSVSGRPVWEEKEHLRGDTMLFERYVCGVGRFYVLTFVWPASESRPQIGVEIMDSFRLVK
jgi:hypothetical protein